MSDTADAQQKIAAEAMDLVDCIEALYGTDYKVGAVAIVVELFVPHGDHTVNPIVYSCSDARRWLQEALLREAVDSARCANEDREAEAREAEE